MAPFVPFFIFCQMLGASVGAAMAVWSEMAYLRAMRNGTIDAAERAHLNGLARGLRFGMTLLLLASLGLVFAAYFLQAPVQSALSANYWTSIGLSLLIIWVSWALSQHRVSFSLGSAIAFTAWWFLAYLSIGLLPTLSFGSAVALLVLATAVFYALIHYGRFLVLSK